MGKPKLRVCAEELFMRAYIKVHAEGSVPETDIILRNGKCTILLHRVELQQLTKTQARKIAKFGWKNPDNNANMTMLIGEVQAQLAEIDAILAKYDAPLKTTQKHLLNIYDALTEEYNKMKKTKGD